MQLYLNLFLVSLIPIGLSVIFFVLKKYWKPFANLPHYVSLIIIGVVFGISAILGTEFSVQINVGGAGANARDASPLCAGLIFGGPAGIISGVIGGLYRYLRCFILDIPLNNDYSRLACSIATCFAGLFSAVLRKYMFESKRPNFIFGFFAGLITEIVHMLILFLTHMNNLDQAMQVVKICTIPMVICNATAVGLAILIVSLIDNRRKEAYKEYRQINRQVQWWLLLVVVISFSTTSIFLFNIATTTTKTDAKNTISVTLEDVKNEIYYTDIDKITETRHIYNTGYILVANGDLTIISDTPDHEGKYIGKNMKDVCLTDISKLQSNVLYSNVICDANAFYMYDAITVAGDTYYLIGALPTAEAYETRQNNIYINTFMEVVVFAFLFFMIYELVSRLVVQKIKGVNAGLNKIIKGDLSTEINVKSSTEFEELSGYINTTVGTLKNYIDEANTRIDKELEFAKSIQSSSLPSVFPAYPNQEDFDIYATMDTAKHVGGDFYDFYMLGNKKLVFLIADVSGKGIPAAMFMMKSKTIIKSLAETGYAVNEIFEKANEKLCEGNSAGMFVTAWLGILNLETGHIDYVNAGHNPPFIYRNNKGFEMLKSNAGFILAGMEGMKYKTQSLDLNDGDKIFLYTDGVTEANAGNSELYGEKRLLKYLNEHATENVESILKGVKNNVDSFVGDADQFDDITMLGVYFNRGNVGNVKRRTFKASTDSFVEASAFLESTLEDAGISQKIIMQMAVAFEEIFVNIAHYAYGTKAGNVDIKIAIGDMIKVTFIDSGKPFNPLLKEDADITLSAEERKIGGLGILMVKKMMDDVKYKNIDGKNIFTIMKKYN